MRRTGPELNFNRSWVEYRNGFGDVAGDHWLGLEAFHHLTNQGNYSLKTEVRDALTDSYFWDIHANFLIGTEDEKYTLKLKLNGVGNLSTNSTVDPWEKNVNVQFSTHDQKNDNKLTGNCAAVNGGGWWFHKCGDISFTSILATECVPTCWKAARHAGIPFGVRGSAEKLLRWAVMKIKRSEDL
ncbi:fibrinogen-like protein 1 [Lingula anatina]|uniref:Fibrinogen-like protein 1 n=1 Tax=Lingula anatina TaxID=7574 RepID=A0A1S3H3T0_LINAN|nr:fibrinogen-like protein 1 [Lingula anatina]|eukprot:XP_013380795.1 fibrinogen-like protein 1 [Lingula anatina]